MHLSELIEKLYKVYEEYGDIKVVRRTTECDISIQDLKKHIVTEIDEYVCLVIG